MPRKTPGKVKISNKPVNGNDEDNVLDTSSNETGMRINGGDGNDNIIGTAAADRVNAGDGDDIVFGGAGDDVLFGNDGTDTAVFTGSILDYVWEWSRGNTLNVSGADGNDMLKHFEFLQFDDFTYSTDGNNAPIAVLRSEAATEENAGLSLNVDLYDFDGDAVTVVGVSSTRGAVSMVEGLSATQAAAMGSSEGIRIDFDPLGDFDYLAVGQTTIETITLQIMDANGNQTTVSYDIVVTGTNDAPTLASATASATEDGASITVDLAALGDDVDSDDDGASLTYSVTGAPAEGSAAISGTTLTFDPGADFQNLALGETRDVVVEVTATDAHGATATNTVTVTVTGTNDAPTLSAAATSAVEDGGAVSVDLSALGADVDSDDDGASLTYSVTGAPAEGSAAISGTTLTFDPGADFQNLALGETRDVVVEVTATDAHGATATNTVTVTVTGTNDAPTLSAAATSAVEDGGAVSVDLSALGADVDSDDDGASLTYAVTGAPGEGAASISGTTLSFDPGADFQDLAVGETRDVTIEVTATDAHGATATNAVTITVTGTNDAPIAQPISGAVSENGSGYSVAAGAANIPNSNYFYVVDYDTESMSVVPNTLATFDFANIVSAAWVPANGMILNVNPNNYDFELSVISMTDGVPELVPSSAFEIGGTYTGATSDRQVVGLDYFIFEDATSDTDITLTVPASATSAGTADVTFSLSGIDFVWSSLQLDGVTAEVTPTAGTDTVTLTAVYSDVDASDTHTISIDTTGTVGSVTDNGDGTFEYDANGQFEGLAEGETTTDSFTYTVDDGNGGLATETATVTITGSNDGPSMAAAAASAEEDGAAIAVDLSALGDDIDSDDDGTTLIYSITSAPGEGSAAISGTTLSFDPGSDFQDLAVGETRNVTVQVTATDAHGATATNDVTITVTGTNDGPVAANDSNAGDAVIEQGSTEAGDATATGTVLANDTDVDATDVLSVARAASDGGVLSAANVGAAIVGTYGALTLAADGTWTYLLDDSDPDTEALAPGEVVTDVFSYEVSDGNGGTDIATLTISITGSEDNRPPVAEDASATLNEDTTLSGSLPTTDPDLGSGDVLTHGVLTGPANGSLSLNADGSYTYTPNADFNGTDSFTYEVVDALGETDTGTITLTVAAVNDGPEVTVPLPQQVDGGVIGTTVLRTHVIDNTNGGAMGDVAALDNGSIVVTSNQSNFANNGGRTFVSIVSPDGTETPVFLDDATGTDHTVVALEGGGFAVAYSSNRAIANVQFFDNDGTLLNEQNINSSYVDNSISLTATRDGGVMLSYHQWEGGANYDERLVKLDASGDIEFGPIDLNSPLVYGYNTAITDLADGGYALLSGYGTAVYPLELMLLDDTGAITSTVTVANSGEALFIDGSITQLANGNIVVSYEARPNGVWEGFFEIFDAQGTQVSETASLSDFARSAGVRSISDIQPLADGGFAAAFVNSYPTTDPVTGEALPAGVYVQSFNADGSYNGDAIYVMQGSMPSIDLGPDGNLVVMVRNASGLAEVATVAPPADSRIGTDEDTSVVIEGISVADVDIGETAGALMTVTVDAGNGTLGVDASGLAGYAGDGTATITLTGSVSAVNAALAGLEYTPDQDFNGEDTIRVTANDNGNSGAGGAQSATSAFTVQVAAVNDAPEITVPTGYSAEGAAPEFTVPVGTYSRVDDAGGFIWDSYSYQSGGFINGTNDAYDGSYQVRIDGQYMSNASLTRSADGRHLQTSALTSSNGIEFVREQWVPTDQEYARVFDTFTNTTGTAQTITVNYYTNLGSDGWTGVVETGSGDLSFSTDDTHLLTDDVGIYWGGAGDPMVLHLIQDGEGSESMTASSLSRDGVSYSFQLDIAAGESVSLLQFASQSYNRTTMTTTISDLLEFEAGALNHLTSEQLARIVNFDVEGALITDEDRSLEINGLAISDVDLDEAGANALMTVEVSAANGTLNSTDVAGLTGITGEGGATMTVTGSLAAVNAALEALVYTPDADFNGEDTITVVANDNGNTGQGGAQTATSAFNVTVLPVNDAPTVTDGAGSVTEDGALTVSGALAAADVDGDALSYALANGLGTYGRLDVDTSGNWTYILDNAATALDTLDAGESAIESFAIDVSDGNGGVTTATVDITVNGANEGPAPGSFDDITTQNFSGIPAGYAGLNWSNAWILNSANYSIQDSGYVRGTTSGDYVVYASSTMRVTGINGDEFDFNGVTLTAAWNDNLNIDVMGYRDGVLLHSETVIVSDDAPTVFTFGWDDVDEVTFRPYGGTDAGTPGGGNHLAMDDFDFML
ncbi:VCBS repeat-containing protein [Rubricella aquisinus]|uniref:VCBS repeat-containing protein n=1 Tax=Rubricella aquisinus TaxID=2028108 RepID=A0A840X212_9RHOB|nr:Ig-like domain-containing protein [Rubricella aquisinus]MBB5515896.1 VCBS repeat-containing protein [Rubricella aquisinus]